jgi:hypothetical protein
VGVAAGHGNPHARITAPPCVVPYSQSEPAEPAEGLPVARIPLQHPDDPNVDPKAKALLESVRDAQPEIGVLNVHRAIANHPEVMTHLFALLDTAYFSNSLPSDRQRELPYLTSALANSCFY